MPTHFSISRTTKHLLPVANRATLPLRCVKCDYSEDPKICGGCGSSAYCSRKCQKSDWPVHKVFCKDFKIFEATGPPDIDGEYKLAFMFPVDEDKPKLVWVESKVGFQACMPCPNVCIVNLPKLEDQLGPRDLKKAGLTFVAQSNMKSGADLLHSLFVHLQEDPQTLPINKCIDKLTAGKSYHRDQWRGNIIVTRDSRIEKFENAEKGTINMYDIGKDALPSLSQIESDEGFEDVTLGDFSHAVALFL